MTLSKTSALVVFVSVDFAMLFSCISGKLVTGSEFDLKMAADGKWHKHRGRVCFVACRCADDYQSGALSRISVIDRFSVDRENAEETIVWTGNF